ncbi:ADC synthase [Dacryopinax primogenitus]|uniref:aminodeoxychorismate synthase n=1 Tax=Dacryopinax primogenitus (strain DJM 731) TaxID=1858805 RepID=M5FSQ7_DACPD|nr:ADC synthase [Dacryopinax primogenitus]EJT98973.1 ADC synthase [Dacryopinax primogenitus]
MSTCNEIAQSHSNSNLSRPRALTTILYEPGDGFYLLQRHVERLRAAHIYLGSTSPGFIDELSWSVGSGLMQELWGVVRSTGETFPQRVRVEVTHDCRIIATSRIMVTGPLTTLTVCLDTRPTVPRHAEHKTTDRANYDSARGRVDACLDLEGVRMPFDVLLWNPAGFVTETSISNVAVEMHYDQSSSPRFVTPRVTSGLIAGVMRQELLSVGFLEEGDIRIEDALCAAQEGRRIIAFNALRKVFEVKIITALPQPSLFRELPFPMGVGVIIDCYDSYTNNLLPCLNTANLPPQEFERYLESSVAVIRLHTFPWPVFRDHVLPHLEWVIISPGPGRPDNTRDFGFCAELLRTSEVPVLGVCLGHQGIASAHGGSIISSGDVVHGRTVLVHNNNVGVFANVPSAQMVRYNSLCVDPENIPEDIHVTAWARSSDGATIEIMGLQHRHKPQYGVQFHLESTCSDHDTARRIMQSFALVVAQHSKHRAASSTKLPDICRTTSYIDFSKLRSVSPCIDTQIKQPLRVLSQQLVVQATPVEMCSYLVEACQEDLGINVFWLDSARSSPNDPLSRYSYLGTSNRSIQYEPGTALLHKGMEDVSLPLRPGQSFWSWLDTLQRVIHENSANDAIAAPNFQCGLVGYLSYEMGKESLDGYESSTRNTAYSGPLAQFMLIDQVLAFDHHTGVWHAMGLIRGSADSRMDALSELLPCQFGITELEFYSWIRTLEIPQPFPSSTRKSALPSLFDFNYTHDSYMDSIRRLIQKIGEGESYEMNLTGQFTGLLHDTPSLKDVFALYGDIRTKNPACYSALLCFTRTRTHVLSTSPELFIELSGVGGTEALMKPIKGTLRRTPCRCAPCTDPDGCEVNRALQDAQRLAAFEADPKERAENLMIVDLIRADLQNFCHTSSVTVKKLMDVEASETVYSLVTSVEGKLVPDVGPVEAICRTFPPGSMTGAPKLRSVELLEDLEGHQPRGIYSGCLGYISVNNRASFNVVIRTLVIQDCKASVGAGGAITWLSDPDSEWDELFLKARSVLQDRV